MAFKLDISPELRARIDAEAQEMQRIFALPDRWLAVHLLKLCRQIRNNSAKYSQRGDHDTYNSALLWDVIPEVARRLGAPIQADESMNREIRIAQGQALRDYVAACMANVSVGYLKDSRTGDLVEPIDILFRESANGNPVLVALDRLVPPTPASTDAAARRLREISNVRGHEETGAWHPSLNEEPPAPAVSGMAI